jgi:hypothetical protein
MGGKGKLDPSGLRIKVTLFLTNRLSIEIKINLLLTPDLLISSIILAQYLQYLLKYNSGLDII